MPRDYFRLLDAAGGTRHFHAYFRDAYEPAARDEERERSEASASERWETYLAGRLNVDVQMLEQVPAPGSPNDVWREHLQRELRRFRDGEDRLAGADGPAATRRREQQLMRIGSAAWGAGLALLMIGREDAARSWLERSALCYRRSLADAEPGSWGRSIGALKARLIARDFVGACREAELTLDLTDGEESPIARYAACLACLTLGEYRTATALAAELAQIPAFPPATAETCRALAAFDGVAYQRSVREVLRTFEDRHSFLEDVPVADTVLAFHVLAEHRDLSCPLESPRLPSLWTSRARDSTGVGGDV